MRVHQRFRFSVQEDLLLGGFILLAGLFYLVCLTFFPLSESSKVWRLIVTLFFFWIGPLVMLVGIWMMARTLPFYKLLTCLIEENISTEEMAIAIRIEYSYDEGGNTHEYASAGLRFLDDDPGGSPAITLTLLNSQPWTKDIVPGTKVKVYGARENDGPVIIETENGFLWPPGHGFTSRRKAPNNSLNSETQRPLVV